MSPSQALLLAFLIGVVAGLRSLTTPAAVAWAAHVDWLKLDNTPLSFMGSTAAVVIFTLLAVVGLVGFHLPSNPHRTKPPELISRALLVRPAGPALVAPQPAA